MTFSSPRHTTQDILYLVPLTLFFFLFRLGNGSLGSGDEAVIASAARGILQSGDWFTLRLAGRITLEMPPMSVWATALFYGFFGVQELSARLFSALCGAGCVLATYFLGRQLLDRWAGFLGALVLASSSDFIRIARSGTSDAPFLLCFTLALVFYWMGQGRNRYLIFSGLLVGLAVMIKGFAAFSIFPVIWLYALLSNRLDVLGRSSYWVGVMLAAVIALPWNLAQLIVHRDLLGQGAATWAWPAQLIKALDSPDASWYFYVRVLVNEYHPWILVAIASAPYFFFKALKDREEEVIFLSVWMFFIFTAVTLFRAKDAGYLLPAYPPLSLSVGWILSRLFRERNAPFVRAAFLVILALHVPYSHIFEQDHNPDVKSIASAVLVRTPEKALLARYNCGELLGLPFYIDRESVCVDTAEDLTALLRSPDPPFGLLIRQADLEALGGAVYLAKNRLFVQASSGELRFLAKKN